jgi:hypothetical protein
MTALLIACSELSIGRELRDAWDPVPRHGVDAIERLQPGAGHLDFHVMLGALRARRAGIGTAA